MTELAQECRRLHESAWQNFRRKNLPGAAQTCAELNQRFPRFAEGWFLGSQIAIEFGNLEKALEFAERASMVAPDELLYLVHKANCLMLIRRQPEALALANEIEAAKPHNAAVLAGIATVFTGCGAMPAALRCNEQAVSLAPRNAIYHYNLAATQRFLGRLAEAEESYNRALALDPHEYEAYLMRAELFKRTEDNNYIKEIKRRLSIGVRHWRGEVQLCFALAKEFEDLGCFDESFAYLKRGADLKRRKSDYDLGADIATIDRIIETYATQLFRDSGAGYDSHEAIFVLGMPRTGTTLVERILGCHSEVQSVGESNNFAIEMVKLVRQSAPNQRLMRSELIAASANVDLSKLGQNYIESTRPKSGTYRFFVDKLPANYLYCGLISLALPNAKIISLVRDPMDTCYSVYKTLFKSAYPFSYDLEEMARYFVAYQRLMAHWHQLLPGKMLDVQYEDLVADQEGQTRRILEHCGLSWEPNVLDFHTSTEATTTASAVQVRQPIYASSIGKWRRFENQLRPAANILTDAGIQFS